MIGEPTIKEPQLFGQKLQLEEGDGIQKRKIGELIPDGVMRECNFTDNKKAVKIYTEGGF